MYYLTIEDIRSVCHKLASRHLVYDEPIPPFELRFPDQLERALFVPQQTVNGAPIYPTLAEQSAVLFYELIKLHPFLNGNKRIACVALLTFLMFNDKWLRLEVEQLYRIAILVAESNSLARRHTLVLLSNLMQRHLETA